MKKLPLLFKIPNRTDIETDRQTFRQTKWSIEEQKVTQIGIPVIIVYYTSFYYPRHSVNCSSFHDPRPWVILHA